MSEYDETWKAIKKAVVIALSEDCVCSGRRSEWNAANQTYWGWEIVEA